MASSAVFADILKYALFAFLAVGCTKSDNSPGSMSSSRVKSITYHFGSAQDRRYEFYYESNRIVRIDKKVIFGEDWETVEKQDFIYQDNQVEQILLERAEFLDSTGWKAKQKYIFTYESDNMTSMSYGEYNEDDEWYIESGYEYDYENQRLSESRQIDYVISDPYLVSKIKYVYGEDLLRKAEYYSPDDNDLSSVKLFDYDQNSLLAFSLYNEEDIVNGDSLDLPLERGSFEIMGGRVAESSLLTLSPFMEDTLMVSFKGHYSYTPSGNFNERIIEHYNQGLFFTYRVKYEYEDGRGNFKDFRLPHTAMYPIPFATLGSQEHSTLAPIPW